MNRPDYNYFYGGQVLQFAGRLTPYVKVAIQELKSYVDKANYVQRADQLELIINRGVADIRRANDDKGVDFMLVEYKKIIDAIQTDAEINIAPLNEAKRNALIQLNSLDDVTRYNDPEKTQMITHVQDGLLAINSATSIEEVEGALLQATTLVSKLKQKEYKARRMYLNTSTFTFEELEKGRDPDLYDEESNYRLIQLYRGPFSGLTYPGINAPRPSLKLFTMSKEEVE